MTNGQLYRNVNVAFYIIMYMSAFSSILTFFAIAVERCKAIFNPIQHLQNVHAWRIFGAIWFISFCIPLPYLFFLFVLQQTKSSFVYDFVVVLVLLFLFLSVSFMFLAAFLKALYKLRHQPSTTDDGNQQFKLTRMAMIMYSTFFIAFVFALLQLLLSLFFPKVFNIWSPLTVHLFGASQVFFALSSVLNPCIVIAANESFR